MNKKYLAIILITSFLSINIYNKITQMANVNKTPNYLSQNYEKIKPIDIENIIPESMNQNLSDIKELNWYTGDLNSVDANGLFINNDNVDIILNEELTRQRAPQTILHEYSHYLLKTHPKAPIIYEYADETYQEELTDALSYRLALVFTDIEFQGNYLNSALEADYDTYFKFVDPIVLDLIQKNLNIQNPTQYLLNKITPKYENQ